MTQNTEVYLTPEGFIQLEEELNNLKLNRRPDIVKAIKEARALGDLSENAEYHSAREEQAQVEARIRELEYKLEHAIIAEKKKSSKVHVGATVTVEYVGDGELEDYKIVGSMEVDPFNNKISNESPIGSAVLNHKVGEVVNVTSPNGSFDVKIVKIA